jgi:hypothetical protein
MATRILVSALIGASLHVAFARAAVEDTYLDGYVHAVLERELGFPEALHAVRDGVVWVNEEAVPEPERPRVEAALREIGGVVQVRWIDAAGEVEVVPPVGAEAEGIVLLPETALFEPLLADPRWPTFSAAYQRYRDDPELEDVGAVSFGGLLPLVQGPLFGEGRWDVGLQAGVFSIFDLDADSLDLVNSDFSVGVPVTARFGPFSLLVRGYHQSSHLGDEYLLRNRVQRINLQFEAVDGIASLDLGGWGRLYGGGGYLVHREPEDLEPRYVQAGVELASPWAFFGDRVRPVAALDTQRREEADWRTDYSVRAGFQLESPERFGRRRLLLLAEYYDGRSPNGQFFEREIEFFGVGAHFQF